MPTTTFENLDDDKRDRVLRAATHEFAQHEYAEAKLDRIASTAKVPKGSLYQYFESKEEFYVHVVRCALDEAWEHFLRWIREREPADCYALIAEGLYNIAALKKEMPDHAALYARVVFARDAHARDRLFPRYLEHSSEFYEMVIPWGLSTGRIDPSIPYASIRYQINALAAQFQYFVLSGDFPEWIPAQERNVDHMVERIVEIHRRSLSPTPPSKGHARPPQPTEAETR